MIPNEPHKTTDYNRKEANLVLQIILSSIIISRKNSDLLIQLIRIIMISQFNGTSCRNCLFNVWKSNGVEYNLNS